MNNSWIKETLHLLRQNRLHLSNIHFCHSEKVVFMKMMQITWLTVNQQNIISCSWYPVWPVYHSWTSFVFPACMTSANYLPEHYCFNYTIPHIEVRCLPGSILHVHSAYLGWSNATSGCEKHSDDCHFAFYAPHVLCEGLQECELEYALLGQPFNRQDCEDNRHLFIPNYLELSYECLQGNSIENSKLKKATYFWFKYDLGQKYYAHQVRPDRLGFKLMTSRSWQYISCYWDTCSNHLAIMHVAIILVLYIYMLLCSRCWPENGKVVL